MFHSSPYLNLARRYSKVIDLKQRSKDLKTTLITDKFSIVRDKYQTPKYPIVLCHGFSGFDTVNFIPNLLVAAERKVEGLLQINYWHGIRESLEKLGSTVLIGKVPPFGTIEERATILHNFINEQCKTLRENESKETIYNMDQKKEGEKEEKKEEKNSERVGENKTRNNQELMQASEQLSKASEKLTQTDEELSQTREKVSQTKLSQTQLSQTQLSQTKLSQTKLSQTSEKLPQNINNYLPIKINLVSHSMGGLDSRYLISKLRSPTNNYQVVSLTTISTPHHGSECADFLVDTFGSSKLMKLILPAPVFEMTTENMKTFNQSILDDPDVHYFSYGARFNPKWFNVFNLTWKIMTRQIRHKYGPEKVEKLKNIIDNDGIVSVESSKWGKYLGTLDQVDHLDLINWTNRARVTLDKVLFNKQQKFNALALYLDIADNLAKTESNGKDREIEDKDKDQEI